MLRLLVMVIAAVVLSPSARADTPVIVEKWLAAQNTGKFADYEALYASRFQGVRRSGTKVVRLDRAGWMRDRKRMFARPIKVAIDKVVVEAIGDRTHVTFVQTFESGTYMDAGIKALDIIAGQIVREDMLTSAKSGADATCHVDRCKDTSNPGAIAALCEARCTTNDGNACYQLKIMFSRGVCGVSRDDAKALEFAERSCKLDNPFECAWPASEHVKTDYSRGAVLYRIGCDGEDPVSCYQLGQLLIARGDVKQGLSLLEGVCAGFSRSAPGASACLEVENIYLHGEGSVKPNARKAREFRRRYEDTANAE